MRRSSKTCETTPELRELQRRSEAYDRLCSWLDRTNRIDYMLLADIETILERPLPAPPPGYPLSPPGYEEHPIIFLGPSFLSVQNGQQTQTRRPVNPQPVDIFPFLGKNQNPTGEFGWCSHPNVVSRHVCCPFGIPGDRLWVRESIRFVDDGHTDYYWCYGADGVRIQTPCEGALKYKSYSSIHMPRWASRITLEVMDVRVQRLQEMSEEDARAEGVEPWAFNSEQPMTSGELGADSPYRGGFACAWDDIYDARNLTWFANPWVWAITFRQLPKEPL